MLFSLIFFKSVNKINTAQDAYTLDTFGFLENGTFNVKFTEVLTPMLYYGLLSQDEFPIELLITASASKFCQESPQIPKIRTYVPTGETYIFNGTIKNKAVYTPIVFNCASNSTIVKIEQVFLNPSTHLDYRWIGGNWTQLGLMIYMCALFVIWMINWIMNFRSNVKIHYFMTFSIIFAICYHACSYKEMVELDKNDSADSATAARIVLSIFDNGCLFIALLLASKGWCVYKEKLSCKDVFLSIIYVVVYMVFNCLYTFADLGRAEIIISLISLIAIGLFLRELIISINASKIHFVAHMYVISNAGINPETTPIYAKYKTYTMLKWSVIVCCVLIITRVCVSLFVNIFFWINQFVLDVILVGMTTTLCFIFRLRKSGSNDQYQMIVDSDFEQNEPEELQLQDVEEIDINQFKTKTGIIWEEGMKLPTPPVIIQTQNKKHEMKMEQRRNAQRAASQAAEQPAASQSTAQISNADESVVTDSESSDNNGNVIVV